MSFRRTTVWRLNYLVYVGGVAVDAEVISNLESATVKTALEGVTITGSTDSATYDTLEYTEDTTTIVAYKSLFSFRLLSESRTSDFTSFDTALKTIWEADSGMQNMYQNCVSIDN